MIKEEDYKMKKIFTIITLLLAFFSVSAQQRVAERTYISTDKENYVAGEALWCSAYCLDITADNEDNVFSNMSSIVYLELHSAAGIAQTGKIALINGRGAGKIILAPNLPTGNYKLIAYTAQNKNEVGYGYDVPWAKTVSIFNTLTKDRVSDGVKVVEDDEYAVFPRWRKRQKRLKRYMPFCRGISVFQDLRLFR